jgi:hypothetical protein
MALMKIVYMTVSGLTRERGVKGMTDSAAAEVIVARIRDPTADEGTGDSQSAGMEIFPTNNLTFRCRGRRSQVQRANYRELGLARPVSRLRQYRIPKTH